jgi:hypothetical protein
MKQPSQRPSQRRDSWQFVIICLLLAGAALLSACQPIQPPAAGTNAVPTIPEVTIEVNDAVFIIPDNFPGGIVRVTFKNNASKDLDVGVSRVKEGADVEQIMEEGQNLIEHLPSLLQQVTFMASFNPVPAGESRQATMDFKTGQFIADASDHIDGDPTGELPRFYGVFTADELIGTVEPQTDVLVEMSDFAYTMPNEIQSGKQLWQYHNTGKQWHMQLMVKPTPGVIMEDVMAAMMSEGEPSGPPPFEFVPEVGISPLGEGERVWLEFDLAPGEYLTICPIPDVAAMMEGAEPMPHVALGMHQMLTVK